MNATAPSTRTLAAVKHVGTDGVPKMYTSARQATATKSNCAASQRWRLSADGHAARSTNYDRDHREGNPRRDGRRAERELPGSSRSGNSCLHSRNAGIVIGACRRNCNVCCSSRKFPGLKYTAGGNDDSYAVSIYLLGYQ